MVSPRIMSCAVRVADAFRNLNSSESKFAAEPAVQNWSIAHLFSDSLSGEVTASDNVLGTKPIFVELMDRVFNAPKDSTKQPVEIDWRSLPPIDFDWDLLPIKEEIPEQEDEPEKPPIVYRGEFSKRKISARKKIFAEDWKKHSKRFKRRTRKHKIHIFPEKEDEPVVIKAQFGLEYTELIDQLKQHSGRLGKVISDEVLKEIEGLLAVFVALKDCTSVPQFLSIVFLYIRAHFEEAMTTTVCDYIQSLFNGDDATTDTVLDEQSGTEIPKWLMLMRDMQQNWLLLKGNKMFKQISKLLGVMVTLGLCNASALKFTIAGYKAFDEDVLKEHKSAFDMADAVFGTITYFAEGAYLCFKHKSLKPLLINDNSAAELDDEYSRILQWWQLVQNGNLENQLGITEQEFDHRLEALTTSLRTVLQSLKGYDKKIISDRVTKLLLIKNDYITMKLGCGVREAPYVIELFGDSSQGKTTFGEALIDALLVSQGMPTDPEYRGVINPGAKHMDNWRTDMLVGILDDVANDKADFVEQSPTRFIIDTCNNQQYVVKKANLEGKGRVFFEAKIMLWTTNKKNVDAKVYSNCPYAVQRRAHVVITVRAKKKYQAFSSDGVPLGVDSAKVREDYTDENGNYHPPPIDDIWCLSVERAVKPQEMTEVATYEPLVWKGQTLDGVDTKTVIQFLIEQFDTHREHQKEIVRRSKERVERLDVCDHEGCKHLKGMCPDHDEGQDVIHFMPEELTRPDATKSAKKKPFWGQKPKTQLKPHFGEEFGLALKQSANAVHSTLSSDFSKFGGKIETAATGALYAYTLLFLKKFDWMAIVPRAWLDDKYMQQFLCWWYKPKLAKNYKWWTLYHVLILLSSGLLIPVGLGFFTVLIAGWCIVRQCYLTTIVKRNLVRELAKRDKVLPLIVKRVKDTYWKEFAVTCASLMTLYTVVSVIKGIRRVQHAQGSLEPKNDAEIIARAAETNVWKPIEIVPLPASKKSKCLVPAELQNIVDKNLFYGRMKRDDGQFLMVNGLFLTSNAVMIPDHYFVGQDEFDVQFVYRKTNGSGRSFWTRLSKTQSYLIPDTDLRVCYSPTGGTFRNLLEYFPDFDMANPELSNHPFRMVYRGKEGDVTSMKGYAEMQKLCNTSKTFYGGLCNNLSHDTFEGLCGAVVIAETKTPCITGFHLGGKTGSNVAGFGSVSRSALEVALEQVRKCEGVILSGQAGEFREEVLGVKVVTKQDTKPGSPVRFIPDDHESQLQYYGTCAGETARSTTSVKKTLISDSVERITGIKNVWGAPKMKPEWFGWQKCLSNLSRPSFSFPAKLMQQAIRDYSEPLLEIVKGSEFWSEMSPLSEQETLCGVPGRKFMDAIKLGTAIGYPLTGPKRDHVVELPPTDECPVVRKYEPYIQEEIEHVEACYRRGERAYCMAKAVKKDEVLPKYDAEGNPKEKCRIFYGNPIALTHLVRKYFLPVIFFLQMNPIMSEQAVGINAHGPEWEAMEAHAMKFGRERTFAGDYSKYDQRMPSQLLFASLRILIDIARCMNYSEEDIRVMEAMTGDIVFAIIAFNGDMIGLSEGGHISGNSLTVILNGVGGSLNERCCYFSIYEWVDKFRDYVAMMNYGDDNYGTVSKDRQEFNILAMSEFLAEYGQVYTMPDKASTISKWCEDADFLCRKTVHNPKLTAAVGALNEDSIMKSLHNYRREKGSPLTDEQACAQNIDTALTEWFLHGEKVYNERRRQMQLVAEENEIAHLCDGLNVTYDERVATWHDNYSMSEQAGQVPAVDIEDEDAVPGRPTISIPRAMYTRKMRKGMMVVGKTIANEVQRYAVRTVVKKAGDLAVAYATGAAVEAAVKSGIALAFV